MQGDLLEQACWLLLADDSVITPVNAHIVLERWYKVGQQSLQAFFTATPEEWRTICQFKEKEIDKLEAARERLPEQVALAEQLASEDIHFLTVLDDAYPEALSKGLQEQQKPPVLFYQGDLGILERKTIAIIGSRNANDESLAFTREVAHYLAAQGANIISGNARGVDRSAYEGATSANGYTTVVLPHGIHELSGKQRQELQPKIEAGKVLLLSQFCPNAVWTTGRAMARNKVVTGLAEVVIVAQSDTKGGTWAGARGALKQGRPLYVRYTPGEELPGNEALINQGGKKLPWPGTDFAQVFAALPAKSEDIAQPDEAEPVVGQLSLGW